MVRQKTARACTARLFLVACLVGSFARPIPGAESRSNLVRMQGSPGSGAVEPCAGLRKLLDLAAPRVRKYPNDRNMQRRAARMVRLQRDLNVSVQVLAGLRQALADPKYATTDAIRSNVQAEIATEEQAVVSGRADLERERTAARTAGYPILVDDAVAQSVVSNVVWRGIELEARQLLRHCAPGSPGQRIAGEFLSGIALALTEEDVLNNQAIDSILSGKPFSVR